MPHDRNGNALKAGDDVFFRAHSVRQLQISGNEASGDEYTPQVQMKEEGHEVQLEATITDIYEGEVACNASFKLTNGSVISCNTKLCEKL